MAGPPVAPSSPTIVHGIRVAMTGVVRLDDDPVRRIRWVAATRKRHLDERPRRERFRQDFIAAHG